MQRYMEEVEMYDRYGKQQHNLKGISCQQNVWENHKSQHKICIRMQTTFSTSYLEQTV